MQTPGKLAPWAFRAATLRRYRLCWCAGNTARTCSQAEAFVVDAGTVLVRGPDATKRRTCVAGQARAAGAVCRRARHRK